VVGGGGAVVGGGGGAVVVVVVGGGAVTGCGAPTERRCRVGTLMTVGAAPVLAALSATSGGAGGGGAVVGGGGAVVGGGGGAVVVVVVGGGAVTGCGAPTERRCRVGTLMTVGAAPVLAALPGSGEGAAAAGTSSHS
jgi:hypothetical protein